LIEIQEELNS